MCVCDCVTFLYSRKLTEHHKPAITEKIKIIIKLKKLVVILCSEEKVKYLNKEILGSSRRGAVVNESD